MPPKALSRFAERGARLRDTPSPTSALDFSLRTKTRPHAHEPRSCSRHSGEARDRLWRSGSRPPISVNSASTHTLYALRIYRRRVCGRACRLTAVSGGS